jgi:hypothetical protein
VQGLETSSPGAVVLYTYAVRVCKTARQAATATALNATVKDWMRDAGLNEATSGKNM